MRVFRRLIDVSSLARAMVWLLCVSALVIAASTIADPPIVPRYVESIAEAREAMDYGKFDRARLFYRIALTTNGGDANARWGLEKTTVLRRFSKADDESARRWIRSALERHPEDVDVKLYMALVAIHHGMPDEAPNLLREAVVQRPRFSLARLYLAELTKPWPL